MGDPVGDFDDLADTLAEITAGGGTQVPLRICEACVAATPVTGAAVSVMGDGGVREIVCATDELAGHLEELQFTLGEGPCVEGFTEGRPVLVSDLIEVVDGRWPMFAAEARRTLARALFVFPLQVGAVRVGVLDLYQLDPGPLRTADFRRALMVADAAMWALLDLRAGVTLDGSRADPAAGSVLRRPEVHQATGMVMVQLGIVAEAALARLRAFAFAVDRPIDEVSREIIARRLRLDEEKP